MDALIVLTNPAVVVDELVQLDETAVSAKLRSANYWTLLRLRRVAVARFQALAGSVSCPARLKERLDRLIRLLGFELGKRLPVAA